MSYIDQDLIDDPYFYLYEDVELTEEDAPFTVRLTIPGVCIPRERPRYKMSASGKTIVYTPPETIRYQEHVRNCCREQLPGVFLEGYIKTDVKMYLNYPKNSTEKQRELMRRGYLVPYIGGDVDNVFKAVTDPLTGILYKDDKYIVSCSVEKRWLDEGEPYVEIEFTAFNAGIMKSNQNKATGNDFSKGRKIAGTY